MLFSEMALDACPDIIDATFQHVTYAVSEISSAVVVMRLSVILTAICILTCSSTSMAGGVIGDIFRAIPGGKAIGDGLDHAHDQLKRQVEPYRKIEEGASGAVRKGFNELNGEVDGPVLAAWINASRSNVLNSGVRPIPPHIFQALLGFFSPDVLSRVRYRAGWGNELALPSLAFHYGDAAAITLGNDTIMFRHENDAQMNLSLWAHELTHVLQYERWGTLDFAKRYVKDNRGVEQEAENNAARYDQWRAQQLAGSFSPGFIQPPRGSGPVAAPVGNFCLLQSGVRVGPGQPNFVGAPCNLITPQGPIFGQIVQ